MAQIEGAGVRQAKKQPAEDADDILINVSVVKIYLH